MKSLNELKKEIKENKQDADETSSDMMKHYLTQCEGDFDNARLIAQAMITINQVIYKKLTQTQKALEAIGDAL